MIYRQFFQENWVNKIFFIQDLHNHKLLKFTNFCLYMNFLWVRFYYNVHFLKQKNGTYMTSTYVYSYGL